MEKAAIRKHIEFILLLPPAKKSLRPGRIFFFLTLSKGGSCDNSDFGHPTSRTVKEEGSIVLRHQGFEPLRVWCVTMAAIGSTCRRIDFFFLPRYL